MPGFAERDGFPFQRLLVSVEHSRVQDCREKKSSTSSSDNPMIGKQNVVEIVSDAASQGADGFPASGPAATVR